MLETQQYFLSSAVGGGASPPSPEPPELSARIPQPTSNLAVTDAPNLGEPGVIEKTSVDRNRVQRSVAPWLGSREGDRQDSTMPSGVPEAAFEMIHGRFTDQQRQGVFKPEIPVTDDASAQDKLLA